MGTKQQVHLQCDHPKCKATDFADGFRLDIHRCLPAGWWASTGGFRPVIACPSHAPQAKAAERDLHEWNKRECDARNAWLKKNPRPKVAKWLESIG